MKKEQTCVTCPMNEEIISEISQTAFEAKLYLNSVLSNLNYYDSETSKLDMHAVMVLDIDERTIIKSLLYLDYSYSQNGIKLKSEQRNIENLFHSQKCFICTVKKFAEFNDNVKMFLVEYFVLQQNVDEAIESLGFISNSDRSEEVFDVMYDIATKLYSLFNINDGLDDFYETIYDELYENVLEYLQQNYNHFTDTVGRYEDEYISVYYADDVEFETYVELCNYFCWPCNEN